MKKTLKSVLALTFAIAMMLTVVAACADGDSGGSGAARIGISLPTMSLQRWVQDGDNMKEQFEAAGFEVDLQ